MKDGRADGVAFGRGEKWTMGSFAFVRWRWVGSWAVDSSKAAGQLRRENREEKI